MKEILSLFPTPVYVNDFNRDLTCGEFDENDICKKIAKDFELTKIEYKYLNRETGLMDISGGILNYRK